MGDRLPGPEGAKRHSAEAISRSYDPALAQSTRGPVSRRTQGLAIAAPMSVSCVPLVGEPRPKVQ